MDAVVGLGQQQNITEPMTNTEFEDGTVTTQEITCMLLGCFVAKMSCLGVLLRNLDTLCTLLAMIFRCARTAGVVDDSSTPDRGIS